MSRPPADSRSAQPPFVLDAMVLAHGGLVWEHEFRGIRFERLTDMALSVEPVVQVRLQFGLYDNQRPMVAGRLVTDMDFTCQRCLQTVRQHIDEAFELLLVNSAAEFSEVPERFEPWLVNATHADVLELVEEQLLLALPLIARHEDVATCEKNLASVVPDAVIDVADAPMSTAENGKSPQAATVQSPFSNLRELMRK